KTLAFPYHSGSALRHGLCDKRTAILLLPRISQKQTAGLHLAAIRRQVVGMDPLQMQGGEYVVHTSSCTSGTCSGGMTILSFGASCGTASIRSVPEITALNTGAATAPP